MYGVQATGRLMTLRCFVAFCVVSAFSGPCAAVRAVGFPFLSLFVVRARLRAVYAPCGGVCG